MRWIITDPRGVGPALAGESPESAHYAEPVPRLLEGVVEQPPIDRIRRLDIYAEGYFQRLIDCLADDFKRTFTALGEDTFRRLIAEYLIVHPSTSFTTSEVGARLPAFAAGHRFSVDCPWLPDLVLLEWLILESFYGNDVPPFDASALAAVPEDKWGALTFTLDTSVRLLASRWAVDDAGETIEEVPRHMMIYRQEGEVWVEDVGALPLAMLGAMKRGLTLDEICEELPRTLACDPSALQEAVQNSLGEWVKCGVIRGIHWR